MKQLNSIIVSAMVFGGVAQFIVVGAEGPPVITSQPGNRTIIAGSTVRFIVGADGSLQLSYEWRKDGTPLTNGFSVTGSYVSGANRSDLYLSSVQPADAGGYTVVVSNAFGSVTSAVATLTVVPVPPGISQQPQSQTNFLNTVATFTVDVTGSFPISFQWRKDGTPLVDGSSVIGTDTPTLTLAGVESVDAGGYTVVVSNAFGSVTSSVATLTVVPVPFEAYEGFDYPVGGWVVDGSLIYPGLAFSGRRIQGLGWDYQNLGATIGAPGTTYYLSFLVRQEQHSPPGGGFFGVHLRQLFIGKPGGGATNRYVLESYGGGEQVASDAATVIVGRTALLVVKCEFLNGNDRFTLYANPVPGVEPMAGAVIVSEDVGFPSDWAYESSGAIASFDEFRIGPTFASVTPLLVGPLLTGVKVESETIRFRFDTVVGLRYLVERRFRVVDGSWTEIGIWPGTGNPVHFGATTGDTPSAFYRLRVEFDE